MKRFVKRTALFAVLASLSVLSNEGFAKGHAGGRQVASHRIVSHRVNQYGNGIPNPDNDSNGAESGIGTNYPAPVTFGTGTGHYGGHGGGNPNPVKPHPKPILGLPPVSLPIGVAKSN
jgi:hypothetical protein